MKCKVCLEVSFGGEIIRHEEYVDSPLQAVKCLHTYLENNLHGYLESLPFEVLYADTVQGKEDGRAE